MVNITGVVRSDNSKPIFGAKVFVNSDSVQTSSDGQFSIAVAANTTYRIKITSIGHDDKKLGKIYVGSADYALGTIFLRERILGVVDITYERKNIPPIPTVDPTAIATTTGNFEDFIKLVGLGVSSNNELTSSYNVRGGNYDENLIYVNGIQIYRPFLVRSGQQEGLSFINPSFVENINFSAGGFDSYYGDKLSSVLDIQYREPSKKFAGSAQASLMGGYLHLEGNFAGRRGNYITGARYRANSYLLNSLPTQGDYNPVFFDYQIMANYYLNYVQVAGEVKEFTKLFVLGHYSNNNYRFVPKNRTTSWGTVNEAYQLRVFFEGQEETKFNTFTVATGLDWKVNKQLSMKFVGSAFHSIESEHFDVLGEYWINELETDPSKEEFGDSTSNVGVGGFHDHGRNDLNVWIGNAYWNGKYLLKGKTRSIAEGDKKNTFRFGELYWGTKAQYEVFEDQLSEWHIIDSAGYSIPNGNPNTIELKEVIKQNNIVETFRFTGYFQFAKNYVRRLDKPIVLSKKFINDTTGEKYKVTIIDTIRNSPANFAINIGTRGGYRTYSQEYWVTPRMNITYTPRSYFLEKDSNGVHTIRRSMKLKLSSGLYYQPPLYRTMRGIDGTINSNVVSQKSWHNVIGAAIDFNMWGRPFKFQTEAYYKYMWDVVPYEIDNVRIRYYAENSAVAYSYGIDAKVNGEFVPGVESFFRIGLLKSMENINNDQYYLYLNSDGDTINPGYTFNDVATDSIMQDPGWIPRPTDQTLTFAVFFQDKMPGLENLKVSANLMMGTPLPYGPPTFERYKDVLRTKAYWRFDVGFMYDFINASNKEKFKDRKFLSNFSQMTLSLDAFNLLGIKNIISYQWLQDIGGRYYAIPNHLTGRRVNLRFIVKF